MSHGIEMYYPYRCPECKNQFDIAKAYSSIDLDEVCPECDHLCSKKNRILAPGQFYGEKVEDAIYDPVFGCIINNSAHRHRLAKERNWEEVGNENPNKMYDNLERQRNEKVEATYDKIFDTSITVRG